MKVAIKNKSELKYIDSSLVEVDGITLTELFTIVANQNAIVKELLDELKESHIVKKDTAYIIQLDNKLQHIDKLEIVEAQETKFPLRYYEIEDSKLKLNKKKVVAL